jgi:hypothetical protein
LDAPWSSEWLCEKLAADAPAIVGIDHGFSFPLAYFERHTLSSEVAFLTLQ